MILNKFNMFSVSYDDDSWDVSDLNRMYYANFFKSTSFSQKYTHDLYLSPNDNSDYHTVNFKLAVSN